MVLFGLLSAYPVIAEDFHFDSESVPYTAPNYTKMFPTMTMELNKYPPPVQPLVVPTVEPSSPPVVGNPAQYIPPMPVPVQEESANDKDMRMLSFVGIMAGIFLIIILVFAL